MPTYKPDNVFILVALLFHVVLFIASVLALLFVVYHRKRPIIKYSQPRFVLAFCAGSMMYTFGSIVRIFGLWYPSDALCVVCEGLSYPPVTVMVASMLVKTYRVWRVHENTQRLRRMKPIRDGQLTLVVICAFAIMAIFYALDVILNGGSAPDPCEKYQCDSVEKGSILLWVQKGFLLSLMLILLICAILARNVPSVGSEARAIFIAAIMFLVIVLVNLLLFVFKAARALHSFRVFFMSFSLLVTVSYILVMFVFIKYRWLSLNETEIQARFLSRQSKEPFKQSKAAQPEPNRTGAQEPACKTSTLSCTRRPLGASPDRQAPSLRSVLSDTAPTEAGIPGATSLDLV